MKIHWQIWFLVTFLICAVWCVWDATTAYSRGEEQGSANWAHVESSGSKSLAEYCSKLQIKGDAKTPQGIQIEVFDPKENPLICSGTIEEAKAAYGLFVQTAARQKSMKMTFLFIGTWILILLAGFGLQRFVNRKTKQDQSQKADPKV